MRAGRHRKKGDVVTHHDGIQNPKESLGLLASAVALQESGILVRGMTATDLSTGYVVSGEVPEDSDPFLAAADEPTFRGSTVGLRALEAVRELVADAVDQRRENPEWAQIDTPIPRSQFPWGIGVPEPDVVVAGTHADILAAYLRCVGFRARTIDADRALWIASDLADVEHELAASRESAESAGQASRSVVVRWSENLSMPTGRAKTVMGVAAVALFAIGGVVAASVVLGGVSSHEAVPSVSVSSSTTPQVSPSEVTPGVEENNIDEGDAGQERGDDSPWREHHLSGERMQTASVPRAQVPVAMDLPGWRRAGATPAREEFTSGDPDMRILVSATSTPLRSQGELDSAVLRAVEHTEGVRVAERAPVSYEEAYPESTTIWHVRLVDGHQVSIGCQFRQVTGPRLDTCDKAAEIARPE